MFKQKKILKNEKTRKKRINLKEPRYDQSTFLGRFYHFSEMTSMKTLFVNDAKLTEYQNILRTYEDGTADYPAELLWEAKQAVDAIVHPDLGTKIPLPFRLS